MGKFTASLSGELVAEQLGIWAEGIPESNRADALAALRPLPLSKYLPYLPELMQRTVVADHFLNFDELQQSLSRGVQLSRNERTGKFSSVVKTSTTAGSG